MVSIRERVRIPYITLRVFRIMGEAITRSVVYRVCARARM